MTDLIFLLLDVTDVVGGLIVLKRVHVIDEECHAEFVRIILTNSMFNVLAMSNPFCNRLNKKH